MGKRKVPPSRLAARHPERRRCAAPMRGGMETDRPALPARSFIRAVSIGPSDWESLSMWERRCARARGCAAASSVPELCTPRSQRSMFFGRTFAKIENPSNVSFGLRTVPFGKLI